MTTLRSYELIRPPLTQPFHDMSEAELRAYTAWFHEIAPSRIGVLERAIRNTAGFDDWVADYSPTSLDMLDRWFVRRVDPHDHTASELAEERARFTFPIDVPPKTLTNRALSIAMDAGIYFAEVIMRNVPEARWVQSVRAESTIDDGQPVIAGIGRYRLNPVHLMTHVAWAAVEDRPSRLRRLFDNCVKMLREP